MSSADHDGPERPLEVRIHGELRKLGIAVSDQSSGRECGHRLFHRANGDLPDFLVFFVLSHHRRRVLHFGLTEHPDLGWLVL